jgi:hypothetical protein
MPSPRRSATRRVSRPPPAYLPPIPEEGTWYRQIPAEASIDITARIASNAARTRRRATRRSRGLKPVSSSVLRAACTSTRNNARTRARRNIAKKLGLC